MISRHDIEQILALGVCAPSGENAQPWRFEVNQNEVEIYNLPNRDQSIYNFKQYGSLVAHGALIENIVIAASHFGLKTEFVLFPDGWDEQKESVVARLKFENAGIAEDPLFGSIQKRVTNRKLYNKEPLSDNERKAFSAIADSSDDSDFVLIEDRENISLCADASSNTEKILFSHPLLHQFFFSHINWTYNEELKKRIGFYIKTLELPPPAKLLFKIWRYWPIMNVFNKVFKIQNFIAKENAKVYASASAIGIIKTKNSQPYDFIEAGMRTQRVWLTAAHFGLYVQPLTGILFFTRSTEEGNSEVFSKDQQEMIAHSYRIIQDVIGDHEQKIIMMFRIGRSEPPSAQSLRLDPVIKYI